MSRLKELEEENRRLKKVYAEERLKSEIIQEAMAKKWRSRQNGSGWHSMQSPLRESVFVRLVRFLSSLNELQEYATKWQWFYNHERPNMALNGFTPIQHIHRLS